jgi:hypothetical protein
MVINQLTGSETAFYPFLQNQPAVVMAPPENGMFKTIVQKFVPEGTEIPMYILRVSEIPVEFHVEVMDLLQFGVGGVEVDERILLAQPMVDAVYGQGRRGAVAVMQAVLRGVDEALRTHSMGRSSPHFAGEMERVRGEIAGLLAKLSTE